MLKDSPHLSLKSFGSLEVGKMLPAIEYQFTTAHIFMFSAVTWNRHLIHYNKDRARAEGHDDVLVQRGLLGNLFSRYVNDLFTDSFITSLYWKVIGSACPEQRINCQGKVTEFVEHNDGDFIKLELTLHHDERLLSEARLSMRTVRDADNARLHNWQKVTP